MLDMTVYAAIRQQTHQMQRRTVLLAVFHRVQKRRILEEIPVLNGLGDLSQILIYDTTRPDIQVAHLRVAHLPIRQSYEKSAGISWHAGPLLDHLIIIRLLGGGYCIAYRILIQAKSI